MLRVQRRVHTETYCGINEFLNINRDLSLFRQVQKFVNAYSTIAVPRADRENYLYIVSCIESRRKRNERVGFLTENKSPLHITMLEMFTLRKSCAIAVDKIFNK